MGSGKIFIIASLVLFGGISAAAYVKKQKKVATPHGQVQDTSVVPVAVVEEGPIEIPLASLQIQTRNFVEKQVEERVPDLNSFPTHPQTSVDAPIAVSQETIPAPVDTHPIQYIDQVGTLFQLDSDCPIVETITYKSRVPWKSGRPAWLIDYASHYKTPIDFIARSLNGTANYVPPPAVDGMRFTVFSKKINFYFLLTVDSKKCLMNLYAIIPQKNEKIALKTYDVCLGRPDASKASGYLTPTGTYTLGSRILTIKPKQMGDYKGNRVELIRVFGTRWIPFEKEVRACSEPAKGFGIHGTPWEPDPKTGALVDNISSIGTYKSDGCIRLKRDHMEELYSIISSRETVIEIN